MIVFLALAAIGLFFLLVSAFFGDHIDAHAEIDAGGFGFLSVRLVAVFFTAFGTVGAIARWYEVPPLLASLWGLLAALPLSAIYGVAMKLLSSQQASSLIEDADLAGCVGRISVPVPSGGLGEVSCHVKAQMARRMARGHKGETYAEGALVRIRDVQGDIVIVEPIE